ncbi:MAG: ketoacyl-ACP synthase III [Planctomycetaceae bacterium]|nr:ketoacyl-ACP synthase III [Planctomycetaceae bacterium]
MKYAALGPIAIHYPELIETNEFLAAANPSWDMELIGEKTGIYKRHIAAPSETASDLGVAAAEKLFAEHQIDRSSIDFVLLCTQTPDCPLPTTSCMMQERLGLSTKCGALDFNLGCSGYVYGLSLADGLIRTGAVRRVLLITAETYSKYINPADRSLRPIFGDAAAATLLEAHDEPSITSMQFGTDGSGANTLLVNQGIRPKEKALRPRHRARWGSDLYMDGPSLINFAIGAIPNVVEDVLRSEGITMDDVDLFLLHQATYKMLDQLRERLGLVFDKMPLCMRDVGNTVSSTLPILIDDLRQKQQLTPELRTMMIGFGVGWSWAACAWRDVLGNRTLS